MQSQNLFVKIQMILSNNKSAYKQIMMMLRNFKELIHKTGNSHTHKNRLIKQYRKW